MSDQPMPPTIPPRQYAPPAAAPRTGLAVTALVLGIVSLFACPLAGILAMVFGIIALNRAGRTPQLHGGRGMAIGGLVCGGVSILLAPMCIAIFLPSLSRARELSKRVVCQSNMKGIYTAIKIYLDDFPDQDVLSFDRLVQDGLLSSDQLVCPSSEINMPNYVIVADALNDPDALDDAVVLYEPKANHGDEGGNVVFKDGHATFLRGEEYDRLIQALPSPER